MQQETFLKIRDILVEKTGKVREDISMDSTLESLEIDSFDFIEFVFFVEDEFGISIEFNYNDEDSRPKDIRDVVAAVDALIAAKGDAGSSGCTAAA